MILGVGTDIIEISRVKKATESQRFCDRVFTKEEQAYCLARKGQAASSFAARFAAKEAVMKAFRDNLRNGRFTDIEILPDGDGCPTVRLYNYFAELAKENNIVKVHISLSHEREYATAVCATEVL